MISFLKRAFMYMRVPMLATALTESLSGCTAHTAQSTNAAVGVIGCVSVIYFLMCVAFIASHSKVFLMDVGLPLLPSAVSRIRVFFNRHRQDCIFLGILIVVTFLFCSQGWAQVRIPGSDESAKLKAAGTVLMLIDTALFVWLARIFAGLCVLSAGWLIKEQKFGPAVVCVLGALIIGTSPMWVQNIFEIGGGGGVFK